jgi:hypothetical protein
MRKKIKRIQLNPNTREKHYQICNIPHQVKTSTYSKEIEVLTESGDVKKKIICRSIESRLPNKHLAFINKVKRYAEKVTAVPPPPKVQAIKRYFERPGKYTDVYEVDLNSAYWEIAYKRGYISPEIYQEGNARDKEGCLIIPKKVRLIALGSLAKVSRLDIWDTKRSEYTRSHRIIGDPNQRDKFFDVAAQVNRHMKTAGVLCEKPLFFWCDAMFTGSEKDVLTVQDYFNRMELPSKIKKIPFLEVKEDDYLNLIAHATQEDGSIKPYIFGTEKGRMMLLNRHKKYKF